MHVLFCILFLFLFCIFIPSIGIFPRGLRKNEEKKLTKRYDLSPRSLTPASSRGVGQRWSAATHRDSLEEKTCLSSLDWAGGSFMTQLLLRNWRAEELETPNVSIAMGRNIWWASISIYFSLCEAAISAVDHASRAPPSIYDAANGHVTVTSQHSDFAALPRNEC